jgi:hypothetical protein
MLDDACVRVQALKVIKPHLPVHEKDPDSNQSSARVLDDDEEAQKRENKSSG